MKRYKSQKRYYERLKMILELQMRIKELEKGNEDLLKELKKSKQLDIAWLIFGIVIVLIGLNSLVFN
ncbi:hypothetical protein [Fusobacterium necrophorum]|uniref:Uncharacterized protein n=2 Tax=Fusobacterium necrophorum TaxID=859 RepID=A0AAN4AU07_9FUSO|nr:hypothetical protein [Fusobacterium necrophorum]AYV94721.1 hypothetical protein BWX37_03410 [Fusobacterium necrophorum subsp. funduliforme]EJU18817.1 hypothetical protein HMPREF1127_1050 [Fusobacterium necrophorum subsp. funduliforme Fnf 1007]KYL02966.1 hypothetical protein A2J06_09915 [Fusobacterium necrophorum subsp. funduliforme]KYM37700.1 hypothetical protein A2U03_10810 [Fusobacterium necrophorum subsp. funduliforme]KYM52211.1 hypothetical protein A2U04_10350 [Fusobacterium necrophorum